MAWKDAPQWGWGQDVLPLGVVDSESTGELEDELSQASVVLLSLPKESDEPRKVQPVRVVVGESVKFTPWPDFIDIDELFC